MDPEHKVDDDSVESQRPITPPTESQDIAEQKASQPSEAQPSTPPDTAEGNELRNSRKREREVSLEPSTPQATSSDAEPSSESREKDRDRRKPAKKYRTSGQLDSTQEEGDDVALGEASSGESATNTPSGSLPRGVRTPPKRRRSSQHGQTGTPRRSHSQQGQGQADAMISDMGAVSSSPPMETKVRMISRGVEDLTWKGGQTSHANEDTGDIVLAEQDVQQQQTPPRSDDGKEEEHESMDHEPTPAASQVEERLAEQGITIPVPPGSNPPQAKDVPIGEDEHGGQADPAEIPAEAQPETNGSSAPQDQKDMTTEPQEAQVVEAPSDSTSTSPTFPTPPLSASTTSTTESATRRSSPPSTTLPRKRSQAFVDTSSAESQSAGVKRKLGDRAVSDAQVPELEELDRRAKRRTPSPPAEQSKKDEEQTDEKNSANEATQEDSAAPKFGGFAAYASTNSPFSAVKGRNIFTGSSSSIPSSSTKSPWATPAPPSPQSYASNPFATDANSSSSTSALVSPVPSSPGQKRSGFEAFANVSPFGIPAKRPKSPSPAVSSQSSSSHFGSSSHSHSHPLGALRPKSPFRSHSPARSAITSNAFSAYANRSTFGSVFSSASAATSSSSVLGGGDDSANASGDESETRTKAEVPKSFGERLRAEKDFVEREDDEEGGMNGYEQKVDLTEQEVVTGEEDEDTVYQVRGKLFSMSPQNIWKEKGTGQLKLNVRREDGEGARLLMRKEAVYTVLLNAPLFKGMRCNLAQDPRYLRFSVLENGGFTHYNFRVPSAKIAEELLEEINSHIPSD